MTRPGYSAISSYSRVQILNELQQRPGRSITELCAATDLHANTVREHVQRLIESGYAVAETEQRTTRGRPRVLYAAANGEGSTESPIARQRAEDAARRGDLMRRVMPWTDCGDLSTSAMHQIDALVDDLGGAGFDPVVDDLNLTVDLSPCPHADTLPEHRGTLCQVHLGIMDGVLAQAGGPLRVEAMAPSCNPAECVVHLSSRS
ncbi:putative ArsR family transcriptional regulator [Microbacterium halimionae]|uniref:Putative ArsR family transcriptional regulator n=1 Tax=Microbacterium halimionae TaxID=1526413 RepID=A0A7W3JM98_9MICO|nr:winged helix-turn-helix transcriptional regulator [Microbacterium halimionae]MBA8815452.1 putative ArsR family transcriptional regulator [Microbacterium halimionae]NII95499.1 putative ArsR family transcriptional regulator [Microbacterium halimionae]